MTDCFKVRTFSFCVSNYLLMAALHYDDRVALLFHRFIVSTTKLFMPPSLFPSSPVLIFLSDLLICRSCFLPIHPSFNWWVPLTDKIFKQILYYKVLTVNIFLFMNLHASLTSKTEVSIPSRSCKGMHMSEFARSSQSKVRNFVGVSCVLSSLFINPSSSRYWEWEKTQAANANHCFMLDIIQLNEKVMLLTQITKWYCMVQPNGIVLPVSKYFPPFLSQL